MDTTTDPTPPSSGLVKDADAETKLSSKVGRGVKWWYKIRRFIRNDVEFKWLILAELLFGVYILIVTFSYTGALGVFGGSRDPATGTIIDPTSPENTERGVIEVTNFGHTFYRAVVASTMTQMILLGLSRFTAFSMYPAIACIFWSKYRGLQAFFYKTPFSPFLVTDTHRLHVYCGWVILINSFIHAICHLICWGIQGNLYLVFHQYSGISGFVAILSVVIIVVPMTWILQRRVAFEGRKYLHYMFWIFCIALSFHAKIWALPTGGFCAFVFPTLIIVYALDAFYVKTQMTEKIVTVKYDMLPSGVQLTMPVSDRFQKLHDSGGYGYVMFDWIDKHQWHAFLIYETSSNGPRTGASHRHIFIARAGDWTEKVHSKLDRNTVRPVWISGPFPSPYNNADDFDNMILVTAGIGITPALSAIAAYRESRRINLVWTVRDPSMLTFFLKNAKLDHKGFNLVFYTGKDPLPETIENDNSNANLAIINKRPNLSYLVPNLIQYIDRHGYSQHEMELTNKTKLALALIKEKALKLKVEVATPEERVSELSIYASQLGHSMTDLLELAEADGAHDGDDGNGNGNGNRRRFSSVRSRNERRSGTGLNLILPTGVAENIVGDEDQSSPFDQLDTDWTGIVTDNDLHDSKRLSISRLGSEAILDMIECTLETPTDVMGGYEDLSIPDLDRIAHPNQPYSVWKTNGLSSSHIRRRRHSHQQHQQQQSLLDPHKFNITEDKDEEESAAVAAVETSSYDSGGTTTNNIWEEDLEARPYVHAMLLDHLETWGLLYCGGRNPLLDALRRESKDLNIPLHEEAFDW